MKYYHITTKDKMQPILKNGLIANECNEIFLFENKSIKHKETGITNNVSDCIAKNQLFISEYVMFEIDSKGFETELINDDVAELTSTEQWILKQSKIDKKYINVFGIFKTEFKPFENFNNK
ncbi:hypothetical protein [Flavobacterium psychrophilum]|uniref:hypothetical protein n=1 Tax=Flavobacterium psychrophilum TaxID=96345 RepID=UPI00061878F4|nr:hypothetical protein [Flavobacterium psychrophilum]OAE94001.1 hypothetical protein SU65_01450 [Flavobacterium psychrophilum]